MFLLFSLLDPAVAVSASGEADVDEDQTCKLRALEAAHGVALFDSFMRLLTSDQSLWSTTATCVQKHATGLGQHATQKKAARSMCPTPVGLALQSSSQSTDSPQPIRIASVSGLSADSEQLAICLAERFWCQEDLTPTFARHLEKWLPQYDVIQPTSLLSPHHMGWPVHRPREYTVLLKKSSMEIVSGELAFQRTLQSLFRKCALGVDSLYVAPQDSRQLSMQCRAESVVADWGGAVSVSRRR